MRNCVTYELRCQGHSALLSRSSLTKRPLSLIVGALTSGTAVRSKYQPPTFGAHVIGLRILMLALSELLQSTTVTYVYVVYTWQISLLSQPLAAYLALVPPNSALSTTPPLNQQRTISSHPVVVTSYLCRSHQRSHLLLTYCP